MLFFECFARGVLQNSRKSGLNREEGPQGAKKRETREKKREKERKRERKDGKSEKSERRGGKRVFWRLWGLLGTAKVLILTTVTRF